MCHDDTALSCCLLKLTHEQTAQERVPPVDGCTRVEVEECYQLLTRRRQVVNDIHYLQSSTGESDTVDTPVHVRPWNARLQFVNKKYYNKTFLYFFSEYYGYNPLYNTLTCVSMEFAISGHVL